MAALAGGLRPMCRLLPKSCTLGTFLDAAFTLIDARFVSSCVRTAFAQTHQKLKAVSPSWYVLNREEHWEQIENASLASGTLVDLMRLLRDCGLTGYEIQFLCQRRWQLVRTLAAPDRMANARAILNWLQHLRGTSVTGEPMLDIPDILTHFPEVLFWPPETLTTCIAEAQNAGVPLCELSSVFVALKPKKCREDSDTSASAPSTDAAVMNALLCDVIYGHRLQTGAWKPLRHYLRILETVSTPLCSRFPEKETDVEAAATTAPLFVAPDAPSPHLTEITQLLPYANHSLQTESLLDMMMTSKEFLQLTYLFNNVRVCYPLAPLPSLLQTTCSIFFAGDFYNRIYPRIEFLKQKKLFSPCLNLESTLLKSPDAIFPLDLGLYRSGVLEYELFRQTLKPFTPSKVFLDPKTYADLQLSAEHSIEKKLGAQSTSPAEHHLHRIWGPREPFSSSTVPQAPPSNTFSSERAHFYRWHLLGRLGLPMATVVRWLPRLESVPLADLKHRIEDIIENHSGGNSLPQLARMPLKRGGKRTDDSILEKLTCGSCDTETQTGKTEDTPACNVEFLTSLSSPCTSTTDPGHNAAQQVGIHAEQQNDLTTVHASLPRQQGQQHPSNRPAHMALSLSENQPLTNEPEEFLHIPFPHTIMQQFETLHNRGNTTSRLDTYTRATTSTPPMVGSPNPDLPSTDIHQKVEKEAVQRVLLHTSLVGTEHSQAGAEENPKTLSQPPHVSEESDPNCSPTDDFESTPSTLSSRTHALGDLQTLFHLSDTETQWLDRELAGLPLIPLKDLLHQVDRHILKHVQPQLPIKLLFNHIFYHVPSLLAQTDPYSQAVAWHRVACLLQLRCLRFELLSGGTSHDADVCNLFPSSRSISSVMSSIKAGVFRLEEHRIQQGEILTQCFNPNCAAWVAYLQHPATLPKSPGHGDIERCLIGSASVGLKRWLRLTDSRFRVEIQHIPFEHPPASQRLPVHRSSWPYHEPRVLPTASSPCSIKSAPTSI